MNLKLYYNCLGPAGTKVIAEALQVPQPCALVEGSGIGPAPASHLQPLRPPARHPTPASANQARLGPGHWGLAMRCTRDTMRATLRATTLYMHLRLRCSGWPVIEAWRLAQRDGARVCARLAPPLAATT